MASASTSSSNTAATDKAGAVKSGPCQVCKIPSSLQCGSCPNVFYCSAQHQKQDWKKHKVDGGCSPLRKAHDDKQGRYWVAARNIKAGELILKELPVIVNPMSSRNNLDFCVSCCTELLPPETELPEGLQDPQQHRDQFMRAIRKSCQKCGWPVCGIDCEKAPVHADNECPLFANRSIKFPVLPPASEIGTHVITKGQMYHLGISLIRGILIKTNDSLTWSKIMELQEKNNQAKFAPSSWEWENIHRRPSDITQAIRQEFKVTDLATQDDWIRLLGILETNQFGVPRREVGNLMTSKIAGLYVQGSLFNHSCIPNAFRNTSYSPAFELHIRAAVDIKKGEMITLNYYGETELYGTDERLEMTRLTSGFVCQCARCTDPTELGTYMSAIICDRCPEKGIMLPTNFQNPEEPYRCQTPSCKNTKSRLSVTDLILKYHREISEDESFFAEITVADITKLEEFISRLSGEVFHPNHWLLLKAERRCFGAYWHKECIGRLSRFLLFGRRWAEFTSLGICPQLAVIQMELVQAMILEMKHVRQQARMLSRKETYNRWEEIFKWASDSLKYWQIDVELTPPNEISPHEKLMKEIMVVATGKLLELRRL